jgi:hypothetical protein
MVSALSVMEAQNTQDQNDSVTHDEGQQQHYHHWGPCERETQLWKETLSLDGVVEKPLLNEGLD